MTGRRIRGRSFLRRNGELLVLALPAVVVTFVLSYLPLVGLILAFKDFNYSQGIFGSDWVGFENFRFFFESLSAWRVTRNTILYNGTFIIIGNAAAMAVAILLSLIRRRPARLYQIVLFIPYFLSWVVVGFIVFAFLNNRTGVVNTLLQGAGLEPVSWYFTPGVWPGFIVLSHLWKMVGYISTIYFARLLAIDPNLYEAAAIDGATRGQQVFRITIPQLLPVGVMLMLLSVGQIFYADFGLFYFVPRDVGPLYPVTDVIDTFVFRALRQRGDVGMASAAGLYQSIVGFALVMFSNWVARRIDPEYAIF